MLATLISTQISEWNIQLCCYCFYLSNAAKIIGLIHSLQFIATFITILYFVNDSHLSQSCFGLVKVDLVAGNCTQLLEYQKLPRTHQFQTFHEELLKLSAHFHDFKMEFLPTVLMVIITHLVSIGAGIMLILGVYLKRKVLLIPWLIVGEVIVAFWASMVIVVIFLENSLFIEGTSVFGLFSILALCLAFVQAYFWVVVQVSFSLNRGS